MSRLTEVTTTGHRLSLTAMEEASRAGRRDADLEHLFLALVLDSHDAGQVLRRSGVTLDRARAAIAEQQAARLAALGITVETPTAGEITFHRTGGYHWTRRATDILTAATAKGRRGDSTAVLRALLAEPSGEIVELLDLLGLSRTELDDELDAAEALTRQNEPRSPALSRTGSAFIPAAVPAVWALVSDPARLPEWDLVLGDVTPTDTAGTWQGVARDTTPAGKPTRVAPTFHRQLITRPVCEEPARVTWRFAYPDAPHANSRRVTLLLEPSANGTLLHLTLEWERAARTGIRRIGGRMLRPLARFSLWLQVSQLTANISRAFR